jgi:hypothetical protein
MKHRAVKTVIYFLLGLAAAISLVQGIRNALGPNADFQWTDVVLLTHHENPFEVYLSGDPKHQLMQGQIPNYLHEMYVVEMPLAWVSFPTAERIWIAVNLLLLAASIAMLVRIYGLTRNQTLLFIALVLCSTGFRNTLGLGQQSFFAVFCFVISLGAISPLGRSLGLGGLYAKYSFAPAVVGYRLARREFRIVLLSLLIPAAGYAILLACVGGQHPLQLLIEPVLVSRHGVGDGKADLMTLIEQSSSGRAATLLAYGLGLSLALFYGAFVHRCGLSLQAAMAGLAAATLVCVKHVEYDLLVLILPLAFFLTRRGWRSAVALAILGYLFYVDRWIPVQRILTPQPARILYLVLIVSLVALIHIVDRTIVDRTDSRISAALPADSNVMSHFTEQS